MPRPSAPASRGLVPWPAVRAGEQAAGAVRRARGPAAFLRPTSAACLLAAVAVCVLSGWGPVPWWAPPLLTVVVAAAELGVLQLPVGQQRWTFSVSQGALAAAFVAGAGAWSVPAMGTAVALAQTVRHQPRLKRDFDVSRCVLATALGQGAVALLGGGVAAAAAGMAVFWAVDFLLGAVAISRTSPRPFRSLVVSGAPESALHTSCNVSVGLLAAFLAVEAPFGLLGLVVPLALLWSSYDQSRRSSAEARLFAELAHGHGQETGRSQDVSAHVVVTAAARLLGGADVELLLLAADGPVCFVGDERGLPERRRVGAEVFDRPWVLRALGSPGVCSGRDRGRPYLAAVLGEPGQPLAVLRARRGARSPGFDRQEVRTTEVLVRQAATWLSLHEPAPVPGRSVRDRAGPPGTGTSAPGSPAPGLVVLRESADRLARLAERSADVEQILEELHLVERAAASLLGAGAEAGRGAPVDGGAPRRPGPAGAEWTTTGVMA